MGMHLFTGTMSVLSVVEFLLEPLDTSPSNIRVPVPTYTYAFHSNGVIRFLLWKRRSSLISLRLVSLLQS